MVEWAPYLMVLSGCLVGIFGVLFGASMFLAVPIFQVVFPGIGNFGSIIGSIKVGSLARGFASTLATRKNLRFVSLLRYAPLFLGTLLGAFAISALSRDFIIPVLILGVLVALNAEGLSNYIRKVRGLFSVFALLVGVYVGFFGAGAALLIMALIRVGEPEQYGEDGQLTLLAIQSRFVEFLIGWIAIVGHVVAGTLTLALWPLWLWWGIGAAIGGAIGGLLMNRLTNVSASVQRLFLYFAFALAFGVALYSQFAS